MSYSEADLFDDLKSWWEEEVDATKDPFAEESERGPTIFDVVPIIDSLDIINALVTIEKHVLFEVPPQIIRQGGYSSFEEMVEDLLPKIRNLAAKRGGRKAA